MDGGRLIFHSFLHFVITVVSLLFRPGNPHTYAHLTSNRKSTMTAAVEGMLLVREWMFRSFIKKSKSTVDEEEYMGYL